MGLFQLWLTSNVGRPLTGRMSLCRSRYPVEFKRDVGATAVRPTVHGDNWAITGPEEAVADVHDELGDSSLVGE